MVRASRLREKLHFGVAFSFVSSDFLTDTVYIHQRLYFVRKGVSPLCQQGYRTELPYTLHRLIRLGIA